MKDDDESEKRKSALTKEPSFSLHGFLTDLIGRPGDNDSNIANLIKNGGYNPVVHLPELPPSPEQVEAQKTVQLDALQKQKDIAFDGNRSNETIARTEADRDKYIAHQQYSVTERHRTIRSALFFGLLVAVILCLTFVSIFAPDALSMVTKALAGLVALAAAFEYGPSIFDKIMKTLKK